LSQRSGPSGTCLGDALSPTKYGGYPVDSIIGTAGARLRHVLLLGCGVALLGLLACELPEAPEWDVGIVAPFSSDPIQIVDFLPGIVQADTTQVPAVFLIDRQEELQVFNYGDWCAPFCAFAIGATIPRFEHSDSFDVPFSDAALISVEGVQAQLQLHFDNGLGFEPLRSSATETGYIAVAIRNLRDLSTVDSLFLRADTASLGSALDLNLDFSATEIADGLRVVFWVVSPEDAQTIATDPSTSSIELGAALDGIEVAAATVIVDGETLDEDFTVDFDEETRNEIMDRVLSGSYELELIHNLELDGGLEISIAGSQTDLFSGDPLREVRLPNLVFTPNTLQTGDLSPQDIELIASFVEIVIGYSGVAWGTRAGNQSRFTADQFVQAQLKVTARVRVGE
jgi:hypothetical protein